MTDTELKALGVVRNADLKPLTTFAVPAKAKFYVEVKSLDALRRVLSHPELSREPRLVLGGGSNILFTKDFDGLVIGMRIDFLEEIGQTEHSRTIRVGAGRVPGTVGGAAVQNIGAYGLEAAERITKVECLDARTLEPCVLDVDECDYGYRSSIFKSEQCADLIVVSVVLELPKVFEPRIAYKELAAVFADAKPQTPMEVAQAVKSIRRKKLPDPAELPNAGSFFKNPVVTRIKQRHLLEDMPQLVSYPLAGGRAKLAAGWLIEAVGMKGKRAGDAAVYDRQALVLVNYGNATGEQIKALADEVAGKVRLRFGVKLEPEPVII